MSPPTDLLTQRSVRDLDDMDLVRALRAHGLYPISGHKVFHGTMTCTCMAGSSCRMPGKHPVGKGWQVQSPGDADARLADHPYWNLGHATGSISRTVVIDIDDGKRVKPDGTTVLKTGYTSLAALESRLGTLPTTISWRTGSGTGEQRVFHIPAGVVIPRNSQGKLEKDIDIRGEGGYAVLPPSIHSSGLHYTWLDGLAPGEVAMAQLPSTWLAALRTLVRPPKPLAPPRAASAPPSDANRAHAINRARAYVMAMGPAISQQGGHDHTFDAACRVVERVLHEDDAWDVLLQWNDTCEPPWSERELRHKLDGALQKHTLGSMAQTVVRAVHPKSVQSHILNCLFGASK